MNLINSSSLSTLILIKHDYIIAAIQKAAFFICNLLEIASYDANNYNYNINDDDKIINNIDILK